MDGLWWVEGDNPAVTDDSRRYGPAEVLARVVLRYWPLPPARVPPSRRLGVEAPGRRPSRAAGPTRGPARASGAAASLSDSRGSTSSGQGRSSAGSSGEIAVLAAGGVRRAAQVGDVRVVGQGEEGVAEALRQVDAAPVLVVEQHRVAHAERRRADADVDDDVEHGAAGAVDVLRLARRHVGEVDPAQRAAGGHRVVGLRDLQPVAEHLLERVRLEPLEEHPAGVRELPGGERPRARHLQLVDLHAQDSRAVTCAPRTPRRL